MIDTKILRKKILDLAIQGKLVAQDSNDGSTDTLLKQLQAEKSNRISRGELVLPRYSVSNEQKQTMSFVTPDNWAWVRLIDITELIEDCPHSTAKDEGKGYPLIRTPNVGEGKLLLEGVHRVSESVYNQRNARAVPKEGDIIYAREAPAGNAAVIGKGETVCLGQRTVLIRPFTNYINSKLLAYFILSPKSREALVSKAQGSTATHVNLADIRPFMLPIPPLAEQKRIVASIEQWFALIDTLEQNRLYLDKLIDIIKNKILSLAIRGQLVNNDPNDEPALKLMRRIIPGFTPIEDPNYADLPNNWTTCRLEDIVDYEQPSRYIVESTQYSDEYMTPVLTAGKTFVLGYTKETEGIYRNLPTIIFDDFTTDSRLVDFPFKVKSSAMKILQVNKEVDIKYVAHFMSVTRLLGDSHKRYWISTYSKVVIPIPPINEQRRIVAKVNEIFNLLENIIQCIN